MQKYLHKTIYRMQQKQAGFFLKELGRFINPLKAEYRSQPRGRFILVIPTIREELSRIWRGPGDPKNPARYKVSYWNPTAPAALGRYGKETGLQWVGKKLAYPGVPLGTVLAGGAKWYVGDVDPAGLSPEDQVEAEAAARAALGKENPTSTETSSKQDSKVNTNLKIPEIVGTGLATGAGTGLVSLLYGKLADKPNLRRDLIATAVGVVAGAVYETAQQVKLSNAPS